jgi:uncharacterized membrane protein YhaH (DUF805 family)
MMTFLQLGRLMHQLAGIAAIATAVMLIYKGFQHSVTAGVVSLLFSWTVFVGGFFQGVLLDDWTAFRIGLLGGVLYIFGMVWTGVAIGLIERSNPNSDLPTNSVRDHWIGLGGRINRRGLVLRVVLTVAGLSPAISLTDRINGWVAEVFFLGVILWALSIYMSALIRRLHDVSINGWFVLVVWIPGLGQVVLLLLLLIPGAKDENRHGVCPTGVDVAGPDFH